MAKDHVFSLWRNTALSVTLVMKEKLLTGQYFLKTLWRPFLRIGPTKASFHAEGKWPLSSEILTILVRTGKRTSMHLTTRGVGIGSVVGCLAPTESISPQTRSRLAPKLEVD